MATSTTNRMPSTSGDNAAYEGAVTLPNRIIKYFVDISNPSQSGFYFYEKAGAGDFVRLGSLGGASLGDASRAGDNTFEIDSSTAENVIYNGLGGADTYVVRSNLDKNIEISDPHTGDDGSGNEVKNTIVFDSDVTVTSISTSMNQVTHLEGTGGLRIELTLDTGAVITVNGPDVFEYVVGGAAALDFAQFMITYGASGITPANRAPVIESVPTDLSIDENADGSAVPVSVGQVAASDADAGDTLTYTIVSAVDQDGGSVTGFEIDGTGLITYVGTGLNAETITSVALTVSASDGQESAQTSVAISVTNIDEGNASFVVTSDGDINAAVAGDVLTVGLRSSDPDGNGTFTYQWYRDGAEIADATGASYTIPEDYDGNSIYVAVRYTDGSGADETITASGIIVPVPTATVLDLADLDPTAGFRLVGGRYGEFEISSVGDINDDGYDDFAVGARHAAPNGSSSGATYVVFGKSSGFSRTVDLSELDGSDGFRIDGESAYDHSGGSISAGDVNDDGYNDIIIGASSGSSYVVFGKSSGFSRTIDLSDIARIGGGVRIDGNRGEYSGRSVSSGDVNDDGYDDIIIGADRARPNGEYYTGSTYVVFGKADGSNGLNGIMELSELDGSDGFRIDGVNRGDHSGFSVSAGDINGDGYDDVIIGAYGAAPNGHQSGSTYVVFGKASGFSRTMELSELDGSDGFRIDGESSEDFSGRSVSSAGDIDGDGYDDIIIGAYVADPNGGASGSSYVVFGKASGFSGTMELSELDGSDGFRINGESSYNYSGYSVSSAGDFNGDGYDDIIIGAYGADWNGFNSGSSYVVFGKESGFSRTIELSELDASDGLRIDGENRGDRSGYSVSSAGDVNDDGYDDIIIGTSRGSTIAEGHNYVIYGHATSVTDVDDDTVTLPNIIVKYFVDTSNPSQSGFYFYEKDGDDNLVRLGRAHEGTLGGDDTFEIDSPTGELVTYAGFGGADTYVIRGRLDKDVQIHDIDFGDDGSGNEVKNTIVFASDVTVTSIYQDRLQGRSDVIKIEQTLDTDAVVTVHVPDAFEYVVAGAAALDFAEFIATYGASGISATNRAPVFENVPTDLSIDENADGSAVPVSVGRVVASDADAGDTLTYSILNAVDQNGASVTGFEVDGTGLITYVGTGLDAEVITSVALTVSASDGQESVQTSVAISVADLNDEAPTITSGATGNALTENATVPNTQVIYTATGTSDVTDISWSLSGPDAGLFNIDRATGEVRFETQTTPDHEGKDNYSFTVVATSGALASMEQAVTIAVTNVDEGNASFVVTSDGDITAAVAGDVLTVGLRSSDPDGDGTFTYQWYRDGVDIAGATGAIYTITEGDEGNSLYVAVRYTDGSGTDETVTASGIIVPAPVDNADSSTTATPAVLNLADLTPATGFFLDGYGWTVSSGDVNGDGYDDIIIGSPYTSSNGLRNGSTYVVFGKAGGPNGLNEIDLSALDDSDGFRDLSALDGSDGFRMDGMRTPWYSTGDLSGRSVSSGDVNGDGYDDIIIGALYADSNGGSSGSTYVVFGKQSGFSRTIELSELDGSDGFRLDGENQGDLSGSSVSSAGDINGDGYDDVIVEAHGADNIGYTQRHGYDSGLSYVVFGKEGGFSRAMDLGALDGSDGFRIDDGIEYYARNGSVFSAGDINGDGFGDIIIGARWAIPSGADLGYGNGVTYVVFGKASGFSRTMDLSEFDGSDGFRLIGENTGLRAVIHSVSSAGDVNGDGYDDIIIGAPYAHPNGNWSGSTYVVFGKAGGFSGTVDIGALDGSDGFRIDGEHTADYSGRSVSSAGDFNGDGYDDIIIGAYGADPNGTDLYGVGSGSSYVVFGKESGFSRTIELSELDASDGLRIDGENRGDPIGLSVSSAGDVNGDGYDDIIIGTSHGGMGEGYNYIIYGYATSGTDLNDQARSPVISSGAAGAALPENTEVGTGTVIYDAEGTFDAVAIVWSLKSDQSDDANLFNIDRDNGEVTFKTATTPDAEAKDSYSFTVVATSGALPSVTQDVTIEVTNIDEGNASFVVTSDGDITAAVAGDVLTVGLRSSDPDGNGAFTYQWYRDGVDIAGATGASYTITEADEGNSLYVAVRYTDGSGTDETVTASGIIVPVPANRAPVFENEPTDLSINENADGSAAPVSVGRVVARDADAAETLTYSIVNAVDQNGDSVTGFEVDGTGLITYVGTGLDAEAIASVALTVSASDGQDSAQTSVAISVTNIDEGNASFVVTSDGDITAAVAGDVLTVGLRSSDPDGDGTFTYQWYRDGVDIAGATGASYTIPEDYDGNSIYVAVRYTDGSGADETVTASGIIVPAPVDNADSSTTAPPPATSAILNLADLNPAISFRLDGENEYDVSGRMVSSVGDINGDGYDDFAIGAPRAEPNGGNYDQSYNSGSTYVVFGKESDFSRTTELSELDGSDGFRIDGENIGDASGYSISAGDVNGDGYNDVIIGAPRAEPNGGNYDQSYNSGSTYVVFGKESGFSGTIDLSDIAGDGGDGFRLDGEQLSDLSGYSVSAGDVNGDGYDDIIIGAPYADPNGGSSGSTYVVFGKVDEPNGLNGIIELSELDGSDGFRINGENADDQSGFSVSSGDVNGDGYDDIIIGAYRAEPNGGNFDQDYNSGSTYVVFGKESGFSRTTDLSELDGSDGFRIDGVNRGDFSGYSVSSAGDVDGDGYDDIIIGARYADPNGDKSGASYIVFGKEGGFSGTIELSELDGSDGFRIDGANAEDQSGISVSSAGDFNGDGYGDIIIGGGYADPNGEDSGSSYVIFGKEGGFSRTIELSELDGSDGFRIDGVNQYHWSGFSVSSAGDIDNDGYDDIIIGAYGAEGIAGYSYVIYGHATSVVDVDEPATTTSLSGIIVPVPADNDDDASEDPVNITYTMEQAPTGVSLTRGGVALSVGETFTHQDVLDGGVALTVNDENALSGLRLTTADGTDANPEEVSLDIEVREVADVAAPEVGNDVDYSEDEGSLVIDTGDFNDQITAARGSDFITGGLGDDDINLDSGEGRGSGQDTVVYNFGSGSIFTATDGGDDITGFKRGEDIFLLKTVSDNPELATLDGLLSYVSGPNKGSSHDDVLIVRPNYEYESDGGHFFLTGITLHFEDAGTYGNGYLAQGHVSITFDERLPWNDFLSLIEIDNGDGTIDRNFNYDRGIIRDLSVLPNLMGEGSLAYEVEAPAPTPEQDVDIPLDDTYEELDDIPATSFDVV